MSKLDLLPEELDCPFCGYRMDFYDGDPQSAFSAPPVWECDSCGTIIPERARTLATERRNDFMAGALAMREAAASIAISLEEEARLGTIAAEHNDESGFKGIGHTMRKHAFTRAKEAIRAIDPAALTGQRVLPPLNADEIDVAVNWRGPEAERDYGADQEAVARRILDRLGISAEASPHKLKWVAEELDTLRHPVAPLVED